MIYELRRGGFALFLRINHSGTLYSQRDTGFSGFVGGDKKYPRRKAAETKDPTAAVTGIR